MFPAKEVSIHFLVPGENEDDLSDEIKKTFQDCKEARLKPQLITEAALKELDKSNKVIVVEKFEGQLFEYLKRQKCIVCGPKCIQFCLAEKIPIPDTKSPVFITAMRDLVVSASNIPIPLKCKVREKILHMGGKYTSNLVESVTHLVTGGVQSKKYQKAAEKGISIMTVEWVDAVWNEGIRRNVHATNSQFNKYKCPVFLDLYVTVSNMPQSDKEKIKRLINSNGGTYSKEMKKNETCLLIIANVKNSQKFTFAQEWELPCVSPSWVYESVEKGYALPVDDYIMKPTVHNSTPTKDDIGRLSFGAADISVVPGSTLSNQSVASVMSNDTTLQLNRLSQKNAAKSKLSGNNSYKTYIDKLNVGEAKRAGAFLEGCKVYLSGFKAEEQDKLRRILTLGGAIVFVEISDAVSHVICGEFVAADMKAVNQSANRPFLVTVEWLVASVNQQTAAPEEIYCHSIEVSSEPPEPPSPLSQKGLKLLKRNETLSPDQTKLAPKEKSPDNSTPKESHQSIVNRKLFGDCRTDQPAEDVNDQPDAVIEIKDGEENDAEEIITTEGPILKGLAFLILDFDDSNMEIIKTMINEHGGKVVSQIFKGVTDQFTDYTIVPIDWTPGQLKLQSTVVTHFWLEDCIQEEKLVPVMYYHEPLSILDGCAPLAGCVITISTYANKERAFLEQLVEALGAISQEMFARKDNVAKGVKTCTHLITPSAGSQKYMAALKWNIPVVTKDWLLACARTGTRLPEAPHTVSSDGQNPVSQTPTACRAQGTNNSSNDGHVKDTPRPKDEKRISIVPDFASKLTSQADLQQKTCVASHFEPVNEETPKRCVNTGNESQAITERSETPAASSSTRSHQTPSNSSISNKSKQSPQCTTDNPVQITRDAASPSTSFQTPKNFDNKTRKSLGLTPGYKFPSEMKTPDTPYENIYPHSGAGKQARKRIKHCIDQFSQNAPNNPSPKKRKLSTPLSVLMKRAFDKFGLTPETSMLETDNTTGSDDINNDAETGNDKSFKTSTIGSRNDNADDEPETSNKSETTKTPGKAPSGSEFLDVLNEKLQNLTPACQEVKRWIPDTTDQIVSSRKSNESKAQAQKACASWDCEAQPIDVGWQEPVEEREKARELGMSKTRKFAFSNVNNEMKGKYEDMIVSLGAALIKTDTYSSEITHLIIEGPKRSEKLLCSIAAGHYILHTSYLDESHKCGYFLPEDQFEWGNELAKENLPNLPVESERLLADAAYRWRMKISNSKNKTGAYVKIKAIIFTNSNKMYENLFRLINSGNGEVLGRKEDLNATHCFIDPKYNGKVNVQLLASKNIYCLNPVNLVNILVDMQPKYETLICEEYKKYYNF
ncbi:hypothetical protein LSTR_LSTR004381 [Laodelphax striatellus]|uniref:DNA topoisomerase 2-binding protein 1-A n=1 Tax=Laodelphax striatellus TaxID=195883 RepID=A0A482X991_LAOST|nr:hypothetical protein LSTR_LSTR004381 [Laodelphax striatellus]